MLVTEDRVKETTATTGTGTLVLAGAASGFVAFSSVMADGDLCHYVIDGGAEWETGIGQYRAGSPSGSTLVRTTVIRSSNSNAAVAFSAGSKTVFIAQLATHDKPKVRILFLGGSGGAQQEMVGPTYPEHMRVQLEAAGLEDVRIKNLAYNGSTFYEAVNTAVNGAHTQVVEGIAWNPDIIIFSFGHNDTIGNQDGRTLAQVKADADAFISALHTALPHALLIYISEASFDKTNFPAPNTSLKNKGVVPYDMELPATGSILDGCYGSEMLETELGATKKQHYQDWIDLDTYVKANVSLTGFVVGRFWMAARLGLLTPDNGHFNYMGHLFAAAGIVKDLKAMAAFTQFFPRMSTQTVTGWQDPDVMFAFYLTASGTGYVRNGASGIENGGFTSEGPNTFLGASRMIRPGEWYLPYKTQFTLFPYTGGTLHASPDFNSLLVNTMRQGPPGATVYTSINGGAWVANSTPSDSLGNFQEFAWSYTFGLPAGVYTLRFKCGIEIYGPFSLTIAVGGRQYINQGPDVASAADLVLGQGNYFNVTGTTNIQGIDATGWVNGGLLQSGRLILQFAGALTLKNMILQSPSADPYYPMQLAGNVDFALTAGTVVVFVFDINSLVWREVSRSGVIPTVPTNAVQADQETATSTTKYVTPGSQQSHPSAAKCWAKASVASGTPTMNVNFNMTSITDTGTGLITFTIGTDFSSANWAAAITIERASTALTVANIRDGNVRNAGQAAGTILIECWDDTATTHLQVDPAAWHIVGYGDQ